MKKKLIFSIIIFIISATFLASVVYALFTGTVDNPISSPISSSNEAVYKNISSEYELRQFAFDRYYNSDNDVSESQGATNIGQRTSLILTSNIVLSYDITINRDIALNLGGYFLDLNGHTLKIEHFYYGTLIVRNGTIKSSGEASSVIYNTPNALINDIGITFTNITRTVLSQNESALKDRVFEYIQNEFDDFYNTDINLIKNYYNSGITFEWQSGNTSLVSHSGRIVAMPIVDTVVEFVLTLSHTSFSQTYSHTYSITLIASVDDRLDYGEAELEEFFDKYRYGQESIVIYNAIELPLRNEYYNLDYIPSTLVAEDLQSGFIINKGTTSRKVNLEITIDNNNSGTRVLSYEINVVLENNLDIANNIVKALEIYLISNIESTIPLPVLNLEQYGIAFLEEYRFINNNNYYSIVDNEIVVDNLPERTDEIYITFGFHFVANLPEYVERDVRIFYVDASGTGGDMSADRYSYHYYLLNEDVIQKTGGYRYKNFTMPSVLLGFDIAYSLEGVPNSAITIVADSAITLFNFDTTLAPSTDTLIRIKYIFEGSEAVYSRDSFFILPGIINNNAEGIESKVLYDAVVLAYDEIEDGETEGDGVLTVVEGAANKESFVVGDFAVGTISSYKGIEYLTRTKKFNFNGFEFEKTDMEYLKKIQGITELSMNSCGIEDADIDMFYGLNSLVLLDLGGNNISNIDSLYLPNTVTNLWLNDNSITNIDKLKIYKNLQNIYLHNNLIRLYEPLLEMNNLIETTTYNQTTPIIDLYYGSKGRYNTSTYILLTNKGVDVYNGFANDERESFTYDADESKGSAILESIKIYGYTQTTIKVPALIYETPSITYTINWDTHNFSGVGTPSTTNGIRSIPHTSTIGKYELYASVTIGSKTTYKIFIIEVQA